MLVGRLPPPCIRGVAHTGPAKMAPSLAATNKKLMSDAPTLYQNRGGPFQYARAFAGLGEKEQTIERLENMANLGPVLLGRDLTYPEYALVRGDPRVKDLRKKVGLPEQQFALSGSH